MSEEEKKETFREAKILEVLNHPNIIRFKEVYKTKKGQLCIVMDYADGKWHFWKLSTAYRRWSCTDDQKVPRQRRVFLWRHCIKLVYLDLLVFEAYSRSKDSASWLEESEYLSDFLRHCKTWRLWNSQSSSINGGSRINNSGNSLLSESRNHWKCSLQFQKRHVVTGCFALWNVCS